MKGLRPHENDIVTGIMLIRGVLSEREYQIVLYCGFCKVSWKIGRSQTVDGFTKGLV